MLVALPDHEVAQTLEALTQAAATITAADLARHVAVLAADSLHGRPTPRPALEQTARYIAAEFQRLGLRPGLPAHRKGGGDSAGVGVVSLRLGGFVYLPISQKSRVSACRRPDIRPSIRARSCLRLILRVDVRPVRQTMAAIGVGAAGATILP